MRDKRCDNSVAISSIDEIAARAGRTLDLKFIAVVVMKLLQRFDDQEIHREPDGAAPIGIAAELPESDSAGV